MEKRRVVITGLGAVSPIGNTAVESWAAVRAGKCGIGPITRYDTTDRKVKLAGEVRGFDAEGLLGKRECKKLDLFTRYALAAADEAVAASGIDWEQEDRGRCGVVFGSGIGGFETIAENFKKAEQRGCDQVSPFFIPMTISNIAAGNLAIRYGLHNLCTCVTTACATGTDSIGAAFRHVRDGYAEVMLCGGAEAAVTPLAIGGFTAMKALFESEDPARASIPFDKERSGFVMGEGAGALLLEEYEHAVRRGAPICAEVLGYGASCDAYHITAPAPAGSGGAACMLGAVSDGGTRPEDVDYINAHGTSTPMNDRCETLAIHKAFGSYADKLMVSSTKSMTGHLLGAAGAVEAIFTALALRDGFVPATLGYRTPDEECDLDIVPNTGREMPIRYALSNSLGFGGHNSSLLLKRWEE